MKEPRLAEVDAALGTLVESGEFAGIVTEAWRRDRLIHRSALGVREPDTGAPATPALLAQTTNPPFYPPS